MVTSQSLKSSIGCIQSSPLSIIASIERSLWTTVHVQQPNLPPPQLGVDLSMTSGHSPDWAFRYMVTNSLLSPPQGGELEMIYVQTSSAFQSSMGVKTIAFGISLCLEIYERCSLRLLMTCPRVLLSLFLAPRRSMISPFFEIVSVMKPVVGCIFIRSVHQRKLL